MSETINKHGEGDLYISPNEDYMIFRTYGRATGSGLYTKFNTDGEWSIPVNMGKEINITGDEFVNSYKSPVMGKTDVYTLVQKNFIYLGFSS